MAKIGFIKEVSFLLDILETEKDSEIIEISWESGRGSGKNAQFILAQSIWAAKGDKKINFAIFRKQSKDLKELWNDYLEFVPFDLDIEHKYEKAYMNGNYMSFNSLYKSNDKPQTNLGKSMKLGADVMVVFIDEATQISDDDYSKIRQAYARFGKKLVLIRAWNTWSPLLPCVEYMASYMPYPGVKYMKEHHIQHVRVIEDFELLKKKKKIAKHFIRTSAYINPYVPPAHLMSLEEISKWDEDEGNTILWAKPGIISGSIYRDIDKCLIDDETDLNIKKIIAGVDFGTTDATSVSLIGVTSDNNERSHALAILDEYYHQNEPGKERKDLEDYVIDVIEFLIDKYNEYNMQNTDTQVLNCYVDYAKQASQNVAFVDMLTQYANENDIWQIRFHKAKKVPIRDRIVLEKYLIANRRLLINKERAPNHVREFMNSYYDTSKITPDGHHPRIDKGNHAIDSFEYGLASEKDNLHTPDYLR